MTRLPGQGPSPFMNPILGKYDIDPGQLRPQWYHCNVSVPVAADGAGISTIRINAQPYTMTRITHKILGDTSNTQSGLVQDGQYLVEWNDEQSTYVDGPIAADLMWGSNASDVPGGGYVMELPYPLAFPGNKSLTFRVTNLILRTLDPEADYFTVQIVLHGIGDWGTPQQSR